MANTEPMISAMFNSGDLGPNANHGQDFGWRLAPEVVLQMRRIKKDQDILEKIASRMKKLFEELTDTDVLMYISSQTSVEEAPVGMEDDFEDEYNAEIKRLGQLEAEAAEREAVKIEDDLDDEEEMIVAPVAPKKAK